MRLTCLLLTLYVWPGAGWSQDYDLQSVTKRCAAHSFKGAVMQVTERQWTPSSGQPGLPLKATPPTDSGYSIERSAVWLLDTAGHVLSLQREEPDERKRKGLAKTSTALYYSKGRLVALSAGREGKRTDSIAYRYLKNGLPDQYMVFNGSDALQYKITYTYKNGLVSLLRKKDRDNMAIAMTRYKYNNGQLTEAQYFDRNFRLSETRRYSNKKDTRGQVQGSYAIMDADGKMKGGVSWENDAEGRMLEESVINADREVTEHRSYTYNAQSEPASEKIFNASAVSNLSYRYTYDEQQNWTRKETFSDDQLRSVTVREIQYRH